jgi:hypothetical protein
MRKIFKLKGVYPGKIRKVPGPSLRSPRAVSSSLAGVAKTPYPGAWAGCREHRHLRRKERIVANREGEKGSYMSNTTRRSFIKSAGTYGVATGVGLAGGVGLASPEIVAAQATHPFGYPEGGLDVERTRQLGYDGFKGLTLADGTRHGGCAFGAFNAIIGQLAEVVGAPYVVGFGTLCGTLNGAAAAIGLVSSGRDARSFISDLLAWYSETPLPTNLLAPTGDLPQSKAESNLCHVSVTHWCRTSGFASGSPERAERCSRLSGDVAAKAVEMLNDGALGLQVPSEKTPCRTCHHMGSDYNLGQFTHGEMNCMTCHIDLKEKNVGPTGH